MLTHLHTISHLRAYQQVLGVGRKPAKTQGEHRKPHRQSSCCLPFPWMVVNSHLYLFQEALNLVEVRRTHKIVQNLSGQSISLSRWSNINIGSLAVIWPPPIIDPSHFHVSTATRNTLHNSAGAGSGCESGVMEEGKTWDFTEPELEIQKLLIHY